ncbi:hypothetical protein SUDANB106_00115 [Streptomyces sp. enrichment culture]|uniref:hypothetical protein n=1 Tax=Streptomyces sp. enrichment culture TaxID=1795815 RepID=UPI003F57B848
MPKTPAQTTADLTALAADHHEAAVTAHTLITDLLADLGAHEPCFLTPDGHITTEDLSSAYTAQLSGWAERHPTP